MDEYLLTVLRYLERNPVRANLVAEACQCPWSSAQYWQAGAVRPSCLVDGPVSHPTDWLQWLNQPLTPEELEALQRCSENRPVT